MCCVCVTVSIWWYTPAVACCLWGWWIGLLLGVRVGLGVYLRLGGLIMVGFVAFCWVYWLCGFGCIVCFSLVGGGLVTCLLGLILLISGMLCLVVAFGMLVAYICLEAWLLPDFCLWFADCLFLLV